MQMAERCEALKDVFGQKWNRVEGNARCVLDRVEDRRRRRNQRRLADALGAPRPERLRVLDEMHLDRRHIADGRYQVVVQVVGAAVDVLLHQRHADALRDAAVDLALDLRRVDGAADVVRGVDVEQPDGAELDVDLDLRDLRREAIRIFDQTFAITYALEAISVLVAVMGIAGALMSIVFDRRREFGLLHYLGAATGQIRRLILLEAGLIGILSNIAGLALGLALSLILIFVINKQSFGWTIRFHWPIGVLLGALSVVYAATVLAGIYPARVAQRLNPIEVVHEE